MPFSTDPLNVLLIVGNPDEASRLAILLDAKNERARLDFVENIEAGQDRLASARYDVVLLDLSLCNGTCADAIHQLTQCAKKVPLVILAGAGEEALVTEALRIGAQDSLPKAILTDTLLDRALRSAVYEFRVEEELLEREVQIRILTDQIPALLWTTDLDLQFTSARGAGFSRLDIRPAELLGQTLHDFFQTRDGARPLLDAYQAALKGESVRLDILWLGRRFLTHIEPLLVHGRIQGTIGVSLDITESSRAEEELRAAQRIQLHLVPKSTPVVAGLDLGVLSVPAEAASGDYVDFLDVSPSGVTLVIGDVAGHGFAAAMLMASARAYLRAIVGFRICLSERLADFNRLFLADERDDRFMSMMLCRIEGTPYQLTFSSAGHTSGFILGPEGDVQQRLNATTFPVGVQLETEFPILGPYPLLTGSTLVLLTDGIIEAECPEPISLIERQFGYQRVLEVIRMNQKNCAQEIASEVFHAVRAYCRYEPQVDDISIMMVKVLDQDAAG